MATMFRHPARSLPLVALLLLLFAPPLPAGENRDKGDNKQKNRREEREREREREKERERQKTKAEEEEEEAATTSVAAALRAAGLDPAREISQADNGRLQLSSRAKRALRDAGITMSEAKQQLAMERIFAAAGGEGDGPALAGAERPETYGELLLYFLARLGLPREQALEEPRRNNRDERPQLSAPAREKLQSLGFDLREINRQWNDPVDPALVELLDDPAPETAVPDREDDEAAPLPPPPAGGDFAAAERLIVEAKPLRQSGQRRQSKAYYDRAVAILQGLARQRQPAREVFLALARAEHGLGAIFLVWGQFGEAWIHYRNSVYYLERGGYVQKIVLSGSQGRVQQMEERVRQQGDRLPDWSPPLPEN